MNVAEFATQASEILMLSPCQLRLLRCVHARTSVCDYICAAAAAVAAAAVAAAVAALALLQRSSFTSEIAFHPSNCFFTPTGDLKL